MLLISTKSDFKQDWVVSGLVLQLIWLYLTENEISLAPMGAPIEHPESRGLTKKK